MERNPWELGSDYDLRDIGGSRRITERTGVEQQLAVGGIEVAAFLFIFPSETAARQTSALPSCPVKFGGAVFERVGLTCGVGVRRGFLEQVTEVNGVLPAGGPFGAGIGRPSCDELAGVMGVGVAVARDSGEGAGLRDGHPGCVGPLRGSVAGRCDQRPAERACFVASGDKVARNRAGLRGVGKAQ
jgi:hypothetical protein